VAVACRLANRRGLVPPWWDHGARRHIAAAAGAQWEVPLPFPSAPSGAVLGCGAGEGPEAHLPLPDVSLALLGGLLACGGQPPRRPTEYELSLGKIADTLRSDYPDLLQRDPDFGIYDEAISLEIGQPLHAAVLGIRGKMRYARAISTLRRLACSTLLDGSIRCRVHSGAEYGCALRVPWTCDGTMYLLGLQRPIHISAISLYNVAPQALGSNDMSLSYRIRRHKIDFMDIQPPSLRSLLFEALWRPTPRQEPVLAFESP